MQSNFEYRLHATPNDPQTPVTFRFEFELVSSEVDGSDVGWQVKKLTIVRIASPDQVWAVDEPAVHTTDGLWWITHADPDHPALDEFTVVPAINGTATRVGTSGPALDFSLEGSEFRGQPPFDVTGALTHELQIQGEGTPIEEGEDEPTEVKPTTT